MAQWPNLEFVYPLVYLASHKNTRFSHPEPLRTDRGSKQHKETRGVGLQQQGFGRVQPTLSSSDKSLVPEHCSCQDSPSLHRSRHAVNEVGCRPAVTWWRWLPHVSVVCVAVGNNVSCLGAAVTMYADDPLLSVTLA